ncbi:hypothetical protein DFJ63DRAFT_334126 [Scheffersomyces coipomensis]|uniref:uncharacterized protein n=1 Tax=Scheffersomyces coipomensis TaxID=1788519 RepID=UPI00315D61AE
MIRQSIIKTTCRSGKIVNSRFISQSFRVGAKGDTSTIDSFKLPSQTSINEWEYKYDFIPKMASPKVPPVTQEAVKQDIALEKLKAFERESFAKEGNSSIKVEANDADVVHGGESVKVEPEYLQDRGSKPIIASSKRTVANADHDNKKPANSDKYIQTSINPEINTPDVVNLSENEVDHKTTSIDKQEVVVEDIEHDNLEHHLTHEEPAAAPIATKAAPTTGSAQSESSESSSSSSSSSYTIPLALVGLGGAGYYYYSSTSSSKKE